MHTHDFATIGFRPFPETQEFVTIGVVALDTAARHFDFVLQDARKTGRVAAMFPRAGKGLFREAHVTLKKELESIRTAVNGTAEGKKVPVFPAFRENENGLFAAITSPREGVYCYPVKGRRMAAEMDDVLGGLVGDGTLDVVDGNVIAEDRPRVRVRLLDGRAGEADE